jgi:hypothetical protein
VTDLEKICDLRFSCLKLFYRIVWYVGSKFSDGTAVSIFRVEVSVFIKVAGYIGEMGVPDTRVQELNRFLRNQVGQRSSSGGARFESRLGCHPS